MRRIEFPSGDSVPAIGQGTWRLGEDATRRGAEIAALRLGLDLGMTLVDTAEMYGEGSCEELVGEAIAGRRDEVFLVSKIYPHNADRRGTARACEASLRRLKTDRLDLYLLHWPGSTPISETLEAFEGLVEAGKIRAYGVSNLDLDDMTALWRLKRGRAVQTNQLLYNLARRGIEWDLLPWCRERTLPVMAYSPFEQGRLLDEPSLTAVAKRHAATPAQVALAWLLRGAGILPIPKASDAAHVRENRAAADLALEERDLAELEAAFPPPRRPKALEML